MSNQENENQENDCEKKTTVSYSSNRLKRQQMNRLQEAFQAINEDTELAKEFVECPLEVIKRFNVNTTNLKIKKGKFGENIPVVNFGGQFNDKLSYTVCASIGFIVCASVGDEF
jgi:hypothetical protein